jgi:hypothetical protein
MRTGLVRASALLLLVCAGISSIGLRAVSADSQQAQALPSAALMPADDDHDGINEALEQTLAERFAPVIYIEPDESNYPVNVDWFLSRAKLQYHEDCAIDRDGDRGPFPIGKQLLGPDELTLWAGGPNCGSGNNTYQHPRHRQLTTIATDPDGQFAAGPLTTGYSDQQTFVLTDLDPFFQAGATNPLDWKTYFHAYPAADGGVMIQYWHVFAFNEFGGDFDDHGGDWDASIQVWLKPDLTMSGVWFSRHKDDHPGHFFCASVADCGESGVRLFDSTHPVVTIDGGGHAAFRSPADWATCNCRVLESVTGALGTVVWTKDTDAFDNPAALRKAHFVCDASMPARCVLELSDPTGGVIWKTWSGGNVVSSGDLTIPITAPSAHGGLVNLGEYNPCTSSAPFTCFQSQQASQLLAGQFFPLNDAFWLQYEGRWGSIGSINNGPRGPVFQGFEDNGETQPNIYRAWYNNGADEPAANDGNHPWKVPPSTSATLQGPVHNSGNVTFVSGNTRVALGATQSAIADRCGTSATFSRVSFAGGAVPEFTSYAGPFVLGSFDGPYTVEYFTIDGLGNVEPTRTLRLTLDTTAPVTSIVQPAPASYPHNATLTLNYALTDANGSGVASFTSTMDDAVALADGTSLANHQPIDLLTELALGSHTFAVNGVDNVGNGGTAAVTFSIIVTPESIEADVNQFLAAGKIKNGGVANALVAKLNSAADARAGGNCNKASHHYDVFIHEVQVQAGKGVEATAAAVMISDAQYLIAHCP